MPSFAGIGRCDSTHAKALGTDERPYLARVVLGRLMIMGIANSFVSAVLKSPLHRVLSGSTGIVRYAGRVTNRTVTTPVQYARHGDGLVILVANPEAKKWWRNFCAPHAIDVLVEGEWLPMIGRVVDGRVQPEHAAVFIEVYLQRFPKVARRFPGGTPLERARQALLVTCEPRLAHLASAQGVHLPHLHLPHLVPNPEPDLL